MAATVDAIRTALRIAPLDRTSLSVLAIDSGLGAFSAYNPRRSQIVRESLETVLRTPGGEVFAAVDGLTIIGYLLIAPVGADQPWGHLRDPRILDVAIEMARGYRGRAVAQNLLQRAFTRPQIESRIYVATGYAWCWDVEGTRTDAATYARRLLRLFERFDFRHERTDEANIALALFNFLAVRLGRLVPADLVRRFRATLVRGQAA